MSAPRKPEPWPSTLRRRLKAEPTRKAAAARMRVWLARELGIMRRPTRKSLLYAIGAEFGVDAQDIVGLRRVSPLVRARVAFAVLARENLGASTALIGRTLRRDHTTVCHALAVTCASPSIPQRMITSRRKSEADARRWYISSVSDRTRRADTLVCSPVTMSTE